MNIKESIQQINELIEAWELNESCLNQTDIDAIKCLLKQNKELKQKYLNAVADAVADYETTMAEKEQLKNEIVELKELLKYIIFENVDILEMAEKEKLKNEIVELKEMLNND